jgi:hypothetical protein
METRCGSICVLRQSSVRQNRCGATHCDSAALRFIAAQHAVFSERTPELLFNSRHVGTPDHCFGVLFSLRQSAKESIPNSHFARRASRLLI